MATSSRAQTITTPGKAPAQAAQARRGLAIFFAVLIPLSALFQAIIGMTADTTAAMSWYLPLMWTPTLAAIVARLALRDGIADVSFRIGGRRGLKALLAALLFPTGVGLIAYGSAWATGLAQFAAPGGMFADMSRPLIGAQASPAVLFLATLLVVSTYGTLFSAITATGEEIGWRGYMLTRLVDAGVPQPLLVSGLIWAVWHVPLILAGSYAAGPSPLLSAVIFIASATAAGYVIGRLRLETGSVWPAVVFHAAWNSIIQAGFDPATTGASAKLWTGESGLLVALTLVVAALLLARRPWTMLRQPADRGRAG